VNVPLVAIDFCTMLDNDIRLAVPQVSGFLGNTVGALPFNFGILLCSFLTVPLSVMYMSYW
jgi:hypothetical protein